MAVDLMYGIAVVIPHFSFSLFPISLQWLTVNKIDIDPYGNVASGNMASLAGKLLLMLILVRAVI